MTAHGADVLRSRIAEVEGRLQELLAAHEDLKGRFGAKRTETAEELKQAEELFKTRYEAAFRQLEQAAERRTREINDAHARDLARIEKAYTNSASRTGSSSHHEVARLAEEKKNAVDKAVAELRAKNAALFKDTEEGFARLEEFRKDLQDGTERMAELAARLKVRVKALPAPDPGLDRIKDEKLAAEIDKRLDALDQAVDRRKKGLRVRLSKVIPRFWMLAVLVILAHAGWLWLLQQGEQKTFETVVTFIAPVTLLAGLGMAVLFAYWMKQSAVSVVEPPQAMTADLEALLERQDGWLKHKEKRNNEKFLQLKIDRVSRIEERYKSLEDQAARFGGTRGDILMDQRDELVAKAEARKKRRLSQEAVRAEQEKKALETKREQESAERQKPGSRKKQEILDRERAETEALAGKWKKIVDEFEGVGREACRQSRESRPNWSGGNGPVLTSKFPDKVYLGDVGFDWKAIARPSGEGALPFGPEGGRVTFPLDLSFPKQANLLISMDSATREPALKGFFGTVLRILCSFPPGKAKFTVFDPIGLGQNFSALMHLADYEESLVGGRIWTETGHFERKLAELTEHIEKVIQKYLRNRYATIDEYNREVSEMAEAYRFLVIADFPTGFSDLAMERLSSILTSGARCGVHVLILWDRAQKLPAAMDLARLKTTGLIVKAAEGGLVIEDETLKRGRLTLEPPPPPETLTELMHAVGRECRDAGRVELSFEIVAPKKEGFWKESAEGGIRIPLGRAGADRLQYLELGRGTSQHALVAGKTGSGKSTLFHVMVTSSALWYAPGELELYLIDFKKGVEFKTYAVSGLPHARAVAIESDREFGLSVLRRIDKELTTRAERFREKGVQDFAGYRKAGGEMLPRTLLLIDEFQEFFTEEDGIAQDAALLLDRIVRQGRAFGVHVILGSQTLGGSYTLARTTLGQMGVRIALQCNEADSYLILNDDNAAARLLSRPGEAIYNNMSGMVEGNNPFQVAWLPDEVRDRLLRQVSEKAKQDKVVRREAMAVFEGNVPADIRNNVLLKERMARPPKPDEAGMTAWIGEANAIKGPTEVRFKNEGGSNLLLVGQQRESALSVIGAGAISIAAGAGKGARFIVLDGSPSDAAPGRKLADMMKTIPHGVEVVEYAKVPEVMEALDAEVNGRLDGSKAASQRIFLVIYDLQRFRQLRQKDDFDFSADEKKATPDKCFANVLSEGPPQKIHTIVWADSLNNLNRTLSRKAVGEFQMRILFQMSAADSSELIDTPQAGKLGLYRGLLFLEEHGSVEKFRPYSLPEADTLASLRTSLTRA